MMKQGICMKKKVLPSFKKHISSLLLCFQLFSLQQIRTGKIYIDYIPNDILCSFLFPLNIHTFHAVISEAVTDQGILKQFFISNMCNVLGICFGQLAFYKISHQWIILNIIMWYFYSLLKYFFFHKRLTVTQSAVVCLHSF